MAQAVTIGEAARSVGGFDHPRRGRPHAGPRPATGRALRRFPDRTAGPPAARGPGVETCRGPGRRGYRAGRDLDALDPDRRFEMEIILRAGVLPHDGGRPAGQ